MQANSKQVVIWSKNNCVKCASAKMFLGQRGYKVEERNVDSGMWTKQDLLTKYPQARAVPIIELDNKVFTNFDALKSYVNEGFEID